MTRSLVFVVLVLAATIAHGADRTAVHGQLVQEVERAWSIAPARAAEASDENTAPASDTLDAKVRRIVFPDVSLNAIPLAEAASMLAGASVQFDAGVGARKGVDIVVIDPEKTAPAVSLSLRGASLMRVLDHLAESSGFQYSIEEDAVVIRPGSGPHALIQAYIPVSRATVAELTGAASAGPAAPAAPVAPAAEAAALRRFFQQAGTDFDATPGSGLSFDGMGMLVTQTPRSIARMRAILLRHEGVRQVSIESKFMEVQDGALEELGVRWQASRPGETYDTSGSSRSLAQAFSGAQGGSSITINGAAVASTQPPRLPGTVSLGEGATPIAILGAVLQEFDVNAVVRALAQREGTDLLSAPSVTVRSGHTATIAVAQEMRYPQGYGEIQSQVGATAGGSGGSGSAGVTITAGTPQDFATRRIGVELRCLPTVESDGRSITLDLNPRVTEFEGFVEYGGPSLAIAAGTSVTVPPGFYQPIFSVREVSTRVTLYDGATLIMGGLTREEVKKVEDRVPVLGSLPGLGRLFRSKAESAQKRNLLIFVTARLVSPVGVIDSKP